MRRAGWAALLLLVGCAEAPATSSDDAGDTGTTSTADGDDGSSGDGADSTGASVDPNAPTFYGDVLPIVIEHCSGCHTEGGIGPFALENYEETKALAEVIALQTDLRVMPPFTADNSGVCNTFSNARWLEDEEIAVFAAWSEAGAPEGDPSTEEPPRPTPPGLIAADTTEVSTPADYSPIADAASNTGLDDYQCFLVDPGVGDQTRYLTGYEVTPGNASVVHHLVGFLVDLEAEGGAFGTNGSIIEVLDGASPDQPGWDCYGSAGNGVLPVGIPVTWAPGGGALNLPEGTGIPVPPGHGLVVQMHYNLANGDGQDSTTLRLGWADSVEREAVNAGGDNFLAAGFGGGIEIPPGEESWVFQWDMQLADLDDKVWDWDEVEVLGILPHMHELGQRMEINLLSGDEETCGVYVDHWDFDWQQVVLFDEPLRGAPSDRLQVTCEWDTSDRKNPTTPGLGTQNEMCAIGVLVAAAPR